MFPRYLLLAFAALLVVISGCRGRQACPDGCGFNPLMGLGSPTITPPATGSYGIQPNDPYYGNVPATPASSNSTTVPVQPASSLSPGWRPADQPGNTTSLNPTSLNVARANEIPMNNVVSSTQTSSFRPRGTSLAENTRVDLSPSNTRVANQPVAVGMPVNDASNIRAPVPFTANGNWNRINPGTRSVAGSYEYIVRPTRSGPTYPAVPNVNGQYNGGILANSPGAIRGNGQPNAGWQQRNDNPNLQNF